MSHVAKEVLKAVTPSFADGNTSTSVVGVSNIAFGVATGLHSEPCGVFKRACAVVLSNGVDMQASATAGNSRSKVAGYNDAGIAAFAMAKPTYMPSVIRGAFHNSPSPKLLTNQVQ